MGGLLCLCGNGMSDISYPSENIAEIYTREDFEKAASKQMELVDLSDSNQEYWYCQICQRLTVIDRKSGKYKCSYSRKTLPGTIMFENVKDWQELFYWGDKEFFDAIEDTEHVTVGEFLELHPPRYLVRISPDRTIAHIFKPCDKEYLFSYVLDPKPDFKEEG